MSGLFFETQCRTKRQTAVDMGFFAMAYIGIQNSPYRTPDCSAMYDSLYLLPSYAILITHVPRRLVKDMSVSDMFWWPKKRVFSSAGWANSI